MHFKTSNYSLTYSEMAKSHIGAHTLNGAELEQLEIAYIAGWYRIN